VRCVEEQSGKDPHVRGTKQKIRGSTCASRNARKVKGRKDPELFVKLTENYSKRKRESEIAGDSTCPQQGNRMAGTERLFALKRLLRGRQRGGTLEKRGTVIRANKGKKITRGASGKEQDKEGGGQWTGLTRRKNCHKLCKSNPRQKVQRGARFEKKITILRKGKT